MTFPSPPAQIVACKQVVKWAWINILGPEFCHVAPVPAFLRYGSDVASSSLAAAHARLAIRAMDPSRRAAHDAQPVAQNGENSEESCAMEDDVGRGQVRTEGPGGFLCWGVVDLELAGVEKPDKWEDGR